MMLLFASVFAFGGFLALSLSMNRHYRQVFHRPVSRKAGLWLRALGWSALAVALIICVVYSGWAVGLLFWMGILSVAGLINILLLAYR